jgi:hypothetical protein
MSFDVFFLAADKPIVKRYEITPNTGELVKHPYPFVYEVTSSQETCNNLHDLFQHIQKYAKQGDCMVKGKLGRQLVTESRKGTTNPEELTEWICLDLDGVEGYQSVDHFLSDIGCAETDYILQWSSSMGIENKAGFRCHIFMQLDKPVRPQQLKNWLQDLNLSRPTLSGQLQLTKTGNSLRWPLDITTCQNDKLLYIAPPDLGKGIADPFPEKGSRGKPASPRITFEQRTLKRLSLPTNLILQEALRDRTHAKVSELRVAAGLPKMKAVKYKFDGTIEYMANPGQATITDMKEERGFVYFNLNGGDSWAYYHPSDSPEFIYNFKGEPTYKTSELLPQYWAKLTQQAASGAPDAKGNIYLAFREFTSGVYWNGIYQTVEDRLELYPAKSETQLRHFMKNNKMPLGESIPDWKRVFEPNNPNVIDRQAQTVNIYNPSDFFKDLSPPFVASPPPVINKIIDHVLGNDMATLDHFYNWLSTIVQFKTRAGTAWVMQGTQGTGKGLLMHNILTPLFGYENVAAKRMEELESQFTEFMENKFIVFIDEIEAGKSLYHAKVTAKLKNLIVEPMISIRNMYRPAYLAPNFASMIFASNKPSSVEVAPDDRRFNVGGYQENKLQITGPEIDQIDHELGEFYAYLMHYPADPDRARTPLISQSRSTLIDISRTAIDTISDALLKGDLQTLWDHLPSQKSLTPGNALIQTKAQGYRDLIVDVVNNIANHDKLTRDELYTIFEYTVGNMPTSPNKLTSTLKHHRLHLKPVWKYNRSVRGIEVNWKVDPTWIAQAQQEIASGAV